MAPSSTSLLLAIASTLCIVQVHSSINYYWRDFNGTIPDDAISAGLDKNNRSVYVGQALGTLFDVWAISPVGLVSQKMNYTIAINTAFAPASANKTYALKVLCSPTKYKFQWISTTDERFGSVENVVQGGWANEVNATVVPLYVGRSWRFGYAAVGRIQTEWDYFKNCIRYMHNGTQYYAREFEVLTYKN